MKASLLVLGTAIATQVNKMMLSKSLVSSLPQLYDATVTAIKRLDPPNFVALNDQPVSLREAAVAQASTKGSVCFVVRRPGLWGLVKEAGVDDQGLVDFHRQYFPHPLYLDNDLKVYEAMGNRAIALRTWNPWRLYLGYQEMTQRLQYKGIDGNMKGEGLIQGGILVFDAQGTLQFAYEEQIGEEFDMEVIQAALDAVTSQETVTAEF